MKSQLVKPFLIGKGPIDVLFLGESPGKDEAKEGKAFVGKSGRYLRAYIDEILPGKVCRLDNVVPEFIDRTPVQEDLDKWRSYYEKRISTDKPKAIVCLGSKSAAALGYSGSILRQNGNLVSYRGIPTVLSVHPSFILRSEKQPGIYLEEVRFRKVFVVLASLFLSSKRLKYHLIDTTKDTNHIVDLLDDKTCAFDIETTSLDPATGKIICASVYDGVNAYVFDCRDNTEILSTLTNHWWCNGSRILHNAKFEIKWMRSLGVKDPSKYWDTMLGAWLVDENEPQGLDYQVSQYLKIKPYWMGISGDMSQLPFAVLAKYNALDSVCTWDLYRKQVEELLTDSQVQHMEEVICPMVGLLLTMEERGIQLDMVQLKRVRAKLANEVSKLLKVVNKHYPKVNLKSPQQVRKLLFETLKLKSTKKTKKGDASADKEVLAELVTKYPKIKGLAELAKARRLESQISREIDSLFELQKEGRIHTTYNFGKVVTGRLSSTRPNLQNISRDAPQRVCYVSRF